MKSNISKTVRDREKCQLKSDKKSYMGFQMVKIFLTSGDPQRSKVKVKTLKNLKPNISKTLRDREKVSMGVR